MKTIILILAICFQLSAQSPSLMLFDNQEDTGFPFTTNLEMGFDETGISISDWADITDNGYDFLQETATNQPSLIADGINGYPALRFDGVDNFMQQANVLTISQPITVIMVFKQITWTNEDEIFGVPFLMLGQGYTAETYMYAGNYVPYITLTNNTYYILTCRYNGASSLIQTNLNVPITGDVSLVGYIRTDPLNLAWAGHAGKYSNIELACFYLYSDALDETKITGIVTYLKTKYGL